jgi:periplasmic protein TonB
MFAETLLESSPTARKGKRWPMATAFTVETIIAAVLVIVPLLSTGVIPLSARVSAAPLTSIRVEPVRPIHNDHPSRSGTATATPRQIEVVLVSNSRDRITYGSTRNTTTDSSEVSPGDPRVGSNDSLPNLVGDPNGSNVKLQPKRVPVSDLSTGQLINRVEPVYPRMAGITGVQGEVKLHAIIARDGSIMSLSVISGHPLLIHAAEDAVSQWRYRPYYLNGEPVEVETFITVHFTRGQR